VALVAPEAVVPGVSRSVVAAVAHRVARSVEETPAATKVAAVEGADRSVQVRCARAGHLDSRATNRCAPISLGVLVIPYRAAMRHL